MKKIIFLLNQFDLKEKLIFFLAHLIFKLYRLIPTEFWESRNFFEKLYYDNIPIVKANQQNHFRFKVNNKLLYFSIRRNSSDIPVFYQIILNQEYVSIINLIKKYNIKVKTIIDAGANVGFTTLYFNAFVEDVEIICLEPESGNFNQLNYHIITNNLSSVTMIKKGLWARDVLLRQKKNFGDGRAWSFSLEETEQSDEAIFEGISLPTLMKDLNWATIDFLKLDIEGAEDNLFKDAEAVKEFLPMVKIIAIEIHKIEGLEQRILNLLDEFQYDYFKTGEIYVGINRNYIR